MYGTDASAPEACCRVVATSPNASAKLTALALVEGTCRGVSLYASPAPAQVAAGSAKGVPGSGGGTCCETASSTLGGLGAKAAQQQQEQQQQQQRCQDKAATCAEVAGKIAVGEEPRKGIEADRSCTRDSAVSTMNDCSSEGVNGTGTSSPSGERGRSPPHAAPRPFLAKPPLRGFHLVDLHTVVRNSVEWKHCLPKVRFHGREG